MPRKKRTETVVENIIDNEISEEIEIPTSFENETEYEKIYKTKICNILSYNKKTKDLDFMFDCYGVRIHDVQDITGETVEIEYCGDIGRSDFKCWIKK